MEKNLNIPAISVLMPVYNAEKYLCEAIDSILQQTFTDFEFLVIDDGSTDKSVDIIRSYSDKRIVLTTKPCNTGLIDTLNMGIQLARGKYIARMDADDISVAGRLQSQYQYMESNPDVLVVGSLYQCIGTDIVYDMPISCSQVKVYSMVNSPVAHPTVMIRKEIMDLHKIVYNKNYETVEDFELWIRIIEKGKVENIPEVLLHYRVHEEQVSAVKRAKQSEMADKVRLSQIIKLIEVKEAERDFVIRVLTKSRIEITGKTLVRIKKLLSLLYENNLYRNLYDKVALFDFLKDVWIAHIYRMTKYSLSDIQVLRPVKYDKMTRMGILFNSKFILKSFFRR